LSLTSFTDSPSAPQSQQPLPLSSPSTKDLELPINVLGERVAFQVSTNQSGRVVPPAKIYALGASRPLGASERYELILQKFSGKPEQKDANQRASHDRAGWLVLWQTHAQRARATHIRRLR